MKTVLIKDQKVHKEFKLLCVKRGISLVDAILEAMKLFIERNQGK